MRILAENLESEFCPGVKDRKVLVVGSGHGEQLVAFKGTGFRELGSEPSSTLCQVAEAKGIPRVQGLFTAESATALPEGFREVDVVLHVRSLAVSAGIHRSQQIHPQQTGWPAGGGNP